MTYDTIYWIVLGAGFVLTGAAGVLMMVRTRKLGLSYAAGSAVNVLVHVVFGIWWGSIFAAPEQQFSLMFGLFGLGIAFVNNQVLLLFGLFTLRQRKQV